VAKGLGRVRRCRALFEDQATGWASEACDTQKINTFRPEARGCFDPRGALEIIKNPSAA
jgi:hypothetical protein